MREFQQRLICDACEGMLLELADFQSACADLIGNAPVELFDHEPDKNERKPVCPRCAREMTVCRVRVNGKKLRGRFSTCDRDGLWFGRDVLAGVFAAITRKFIGYVGGYKSGDHTRQTFQPRSGGDASDGLTIAQWRNRPRKRAQTLTPVNAYRDQTLRCPVCPGRELAFLGDRYACEQCHGVLVENAALEELVHEMTSEPWQMPAMAGAPGPRTCPVCAAVLGVESLEGVSIDRCAHHGVWFDTQELEGLLQHAGTPPGGITGWLRRLF
jgi:ribosomal protein S27AE